MFIVIVIDSQDVVWENVIFFSFLQENNNNKKNIQKANVESKAFKRKKEKKHLIYHTPW